MNSAEPHPLGEVLQSGLSQLRNQVAPFTNMDLPEAATEAILSVVLLCFEREKSLLCPAWSQAPSRTTALNALIA